MRSLLKALACILASYWAYGLYVRMFEKREVTEFAPKPGPRELAGGLFIGASLFILTIGALAGLGIYHSSGVGSWTSVIVPLAVAMVIGTFEEIVFRGIIFRIFEKSLGTWISLVISAVIFGTLHLVSPDSTLLGACSIVVGASFLLTGAYKLTGRLWLPIGIHVAWNFTQGGIFGVAVSGHPAQGLFHGTLSGPEWLSGGSFGAEASVIATALCFMTGLAFFILAIRRRRMVRPHWCPSDPALGLSEVLPVAP
jgi:membrane protease YdiL (CAAX protease family)